MILWVLIVYACLGYGISTPITLSKRYNPIVPRNPFNPFDPINRERFLHHLHQSLPRPQPGLSMDSGLISTPHPISTPFQSPSNRIRPQEQEAVPYEQIVKEEKLNLRRKIAEAPFFSSDVSSNIAERVKNANTPSLNAAEEVLEEGSSAKNNEGSKPTILSRLNEWKSNWYWYWKQRRFFKAIIKCDYKAFYEYLRDYPTLVEAVNSQGQTVLMLVSYYGNKYMINNLLARKVAALKSISIKEANDMLATHQLAELDLKAYMNQADNDGNTALFYAALSERYDNVFTLLRFGAEWNYHNLKNVSARDMSSSLLIRTALSDAATTDICAICLESFKETVDMPRSLAFDCGHSFHKGCSSTLRKCPLCRKNRMRNYEVVLAGGPIVM